MLLVPSVGGGRLDIAGPNRVGRNMHGSGVRRNRRAAVFARRLPDRSDQVRGESLAKDAGQEMRVKRGRAISAAAR
jgi:hypothetical protein